jgi:hypothetical protein
MVYKSMTNIDILARKPQRRKDNQFFYVLLFSGLFQDFLTNIIFLSFGPCGIFRLCGLFRLSDYAKFLPALTIP